PMPPHLIQQLFAREQSPAIANKRAKQFELERTDFDRLAGAAQLAAGEVDLRIAECEGTLPFGWSCCPPQKRANAGAQLVRTEGFREVVIGPQIEAQHLICL